MFYKSYLYFRGKEATIKDFKLEILICFNSSITNIEPLTPNTHILPIPSPNWEIFLMFEVLGVRL